MSKTLIVTSISHPTKAMKELANGAGANNLRFICIGDAKSPHRYILDNCEFFSLDDQQKITFETSALLPVGHYSRKNIGYLIAIRDGAQEILETDDDNSPLSDFWTRHSPLVKGRVKSNSEWVNAYSFFTDQKIWPRGFPLEKIGIPERGSIDCTGEHFSPIQQGLANGDADVDAVYRLTNNSLITFSDDEPLILGKGVWCPFNSQNTWWTSVAFELMYLPSYCSFRMTDIWRSFVAQACLWPNDWRLSFHAPSVFQERNQHDLLRDFQDEVPGYLNNQKIVDVFNSLNLRKGQYALHENMFLCYEKLIEMGLVEAKELEILSAWHRDLVNVGLEFLE